jgi:hypothetical protein
MQMHGVEVWLHTFLNSTIAGGEWLASWPSHCSPVERTLVPIGQEGGCGLQSWSGYGKQKNPALLRIKAQSYKPDPVTTEQLWLLSTCQSHSI